MQGIKLITQMVFLLLYFFSPVKPEITDAPSVKRNVSFMDEGLGGYYRRVEEPVFEIEIETMNSGKADESTGSIDWNADYEKPEQFGKAMVTSKGFQIISGPYAGIYVTADEVDMMECVVQRETHGSLEHRKIVAEVIMNRVADSHFPSSVKEVLTAPRQFPTVSNYYNRKQPPDETTKQAVYEVLTGEGIYASGGALYFYDPRYANANLANWFENDLEFVFEFESHRYFK